MSLLEIKEISHAYGQEPILRDLSYSLEKGQIGCILGPSGSGKTTLLRLVAGFETLEKGEIWLGGEMVSKRGWSQPPEKRSVGVVFQDFALFPHLTLAENIAFGLRGWKKGKKKKRTEELLNLIGLNGSPYPHQISGGEQQRVALARALAPQPRLVLFDEPFSNLDTALRARIRGEVKEILRQTETTSIFVTHDQEEALSLADQISVMWKGALLQTATPREIYFQPATPQVARLTGEVNFTKGMARGDFVECPLGKLPLSTRQKGRVKVLIRPEQFSFSPSEGREAKILDREFLGARQIVHFEVNSEKKIAFKAFLDSHQPLEKGEIFLQIKGPLHSWKIC